MAARLSTPRLFGLLALTIVAISIIRISLSNGLSRARPFVALSIDGGNAIAAAEAAALMIASDAKASRAEAFRLGKAALGRDATQVKAASTVALLYGMRGEMHRASSLMRYAQSVSRRDLSTQLWLIEDSVRKGDVRTAVEHYDIALRTSKRAQGILFPILESAVAQPDVADALAQRMSAEPNWAGPLLYELARHDVSAPAVARLFGALAQRGAHYDQRNADLFIQRAVRTGDVDSGWRVYRLVEPVRARATLRDGGFAELLSRAVPFEWELTDQSELMAVRDQRGASRVLRLEATSGFGGVVARQLIRAQPGAHVLRGTVFELSQPAGSGPYATVTCANAGARLTTTDLPRAGEKGRQFTARFDVPSAGCRAQWVELWIRASYDAGGVSTAVDDLAVG